MCGTKILARLRAEIAALGKFSSLHIVSSPKVWRSAGKAIHRGLGTFCHHPPHKRRRVREKPAQR
jgi:hypothetical protein